MSKSLLAQLPKIVEDGKRQAQQILDDLESSRRVGFATREVVVPSKDRQDIDGLDAMMRTADVNGRLIYGDNLLAMAGLLAGDDEHSSLRGKVDLIYIDPPFDSKADYRTKLNLPDASVEQRPNALEQFAYSDTWGEGTASYLAMITPRLVLMKELLAETGSLYVHLDANVGHYVKIVLDEVFGRDAFQREIVWRIGWVSGYKSAAKNWIRNHDDIFFYTKNRSKFYFDKRYIPYPKGYVRRDGNPPTGQGYPIEDTWNTSDLDRLDSIQIMSFSKEKVGYATQKNQALLQRIIDSSCPPGGLVADFFVGSGTTAAAAEASGRRWITSDFGKPAIMITRKRLVDQDSRPFLYQEIGDYQVEQARNAFGRKYRVGDLARIILELYGALPLDPAENVSGTLGYLPGDNTLVMADSPAKLTNFTTLRRAQAYRDSKLGGFDKVVVLGWNFPAGIGQQVKDLHDDRLEVRVIPPDLINRLKSKGKNALATNVVFSTLQYLEAAIEKTHAREDHDEVTISLTNYVLLSPEAINIRPEDRETVTRIMNNEPLSLIEYWSIDPDYDGEVFRSTWQDYRGNTDNDDDPFRVITRTTVDVPRNGTGRVCVRAVDVFGLESEVLLEVRP